jgi:hypothetical protein
MSTSYERLDLLSIFTDHFWKGDIDAIKLLFPHLGHVITLDYIREILLKLVSYQPNVDEEKNLREVFNFLYENSANIILF